MHVSAIVLAAGRGFRLNSKLPKPLIKIGSQPIIIFSLNTLSKHSLVKDIIVVVNSLNQKNIVDKIRHCGIAKIKQIILGGRKRQDSVRNGLKAIDGRSDLVLIHDAARPFIKKEAISSLIKEAESCGAAILGVPVKATIKKVKTQSSKSKSKFIVEKTLDRNNLWEIQTPQVFKKDLIFEAYKKFANINVTDDAMLAEKLGCKVSVVFGSYDNIKITTPEDLVIAQAISRKWNTE